MRKFWIIIAFALVGCSTELPHPEENTPNPIAVSIPDELQINKEAVGFIYKSTNDINRWKDSLAQMAAICQAYSQNAQGTFSFMEKYRHKQSLLKFKMTMGDFANEMEYLMTQISNIEAGMTPREIIAFHAIKTEYVEEIQAIYHQYQTYSSIR